MKTPALVVPDIYNMLELHESPRTPLEQEEAIEDFGEECKAFMRDAIAPPQERSGLRLSAIGKPGRRLWNQFYGIKGIPIDGPTYIKFLYGHLTEAMVVSLAKLSGHEVTEQQKEIEVEGVKGHQDGRLDGMLFDVKSASSYGFKKFKYNKLHEDDQFGYIPQIKAYAAQEGDTKYGWLAMDKSTGHLAWLEYDEEDTKAPYHDDVNWCVKERIRDLKKLLGGPLPPKCYGDVPDGKSGNRKLQTGCAYCEYKDTCWPSLRTFYYSSGPKYLTVVERDPRVKEVPSDF